ncbi:Zinc transporter ZIP10, partial [Geodia barretti]
RELCDAVTATVADDGECRVNCSHLLAICSGSSLQYFQLADGELQAEANNTTNSTSVYITQAEAYGYGFVMIFIISLLSLLGVVIVPLIRQNSRLLLVYKHLISLLIAMGVAALTTDALLHLIPNAIGIHSHDSGDIHKEIDERDVVWKMCAVLAGALSFFLLELLLHSCTARFGHTHSHGLLESTRLSSESLLLNHKSQPEGPGGEGKEEAPPSDKTEVMGDKPLSEHDYGTVGRNDANTTYHTAPGCLSPVTSIKPLAWVIIIGDGMHNLTDGLAVGVAISQSLGLGLSTAMAILFHEIPHELSDYAILLHTGMSWYKALFLNFASALTSVLGFFVGVAIGTDSEESEEWLLAVIAGQFLYIALVDLLPELLHSKEEGLQKVLQVIMSVLGLAVGFSVLLVIALFEDTINVSVN